MTEPTLHCGLITDDQLMEQMEIGDIRTLNKMVELGDLPERSFGGEGTKVRGWHVKVLETFYMERYELQQGQ